MKEVMESILCTPNSSSKRSLVSAHKAYIAENETSDQKLPLLVTAPPGQARLPSAARAEPAVRAQWVVGPVSGFQGGGPRVLPEPVMGERPVGTRHPARTLH